jgi:hypothetical protein
MKIIIYFVNDKSVSLEDCSEETFQSFKIAMEESQLIDLTIEGRSSMLINFDHVAFIKKEKGTS